MDQPLDYKLLTYIAYGLKKSHRYTHNETQQVLHEIFRGKYEISTLRKEFSILKQNNLITFDTYYRQPYPVLTADGKMAIKTVLPFKKYGLWDKKWRLVLFDIPEEDRNLRVKLTQFLESLGFEQMKNSAYLSPHPLLNTVSRYATSLGLRQHLNLMTIDKLEDEAKVVTQTWRLTDINRKYEHFLVLAMKNRIKEYWPLLAKKLEMEFAAVYKIDPQLPPEFLPPEFLGPDAYKKFKEISNSY